MKTFACILFLSFLSCHNSQNRSNRVEGNIITINYPEKSFQTMMYLGNKWTWGMEVLENTLNDTAMIGIMKLPPGITGNLFKTDCFSDSLAFEYQPYKATKGKVVLKYYSGNY